MEGTSLFNLSYYKDIVSDKSKVDEKNTVALMPCQMLCNVICLISYLKICTFMYLYWVFINLKLVLDDISI